MHMLSQNRSGALPDEGGRMLTKIPSGLAEVMAVFGDPNALDFETKHIVELVLPFSLFYEGKPVHRSRCHVKAKDHFLMALNGIHDAKLTDVVRNYGGITSIPPRVKRTNSSDLSTHSWGIAIDIEPQTYTLGSSKRLPDDVVRIFRDAGFFYGGDFKKTKDPMHFQLCVGY
jgi:hypothetical protein